MIPTLVVLCLSSKHELLKTQNKPLLFKNKNANKVNILLQFGVKQLSASRSKVFLYAANCSLLAYFSKET